MIGRREGQEEGKKRREERSITDVDEGPEYMRKIHAV